MTSSQVLNQGDAVIVGNNLDIIEVEPPSPPLESNSEGAGPGAAFKSLVHGGASAPTIAPLHQRPSHAYRCYLQRSLMPSNTGVLEFIQVKAANATQAARAALAVSGAMAVVEVERIEQVAA